MDQKQILTEMLGRLHGIKDTCYDLYFEASSGHNARYEDNRIEEISSFTSRGTGARLILKDSSVYSYAPSTSVQSALHCMSETLTDTDIYIDLPSTGRNFSSETLSFDGKLEYPDYGFMRGLDRHIRKKSELVTQVSMSMDCSKKQIMILRDDGTSENETRFYSTFMVQVVVRERKTIQTGFESTAFSLPLEEFMHSVNLERSVEKALNRALLMLEARKCPAGNMPVILSGEAGGTMIHEACGHGLEADIIQKDYSVYRNSIGKKVASEKVTLIDDGTLPGYYGSSSYDDEGTPSSKTVLIEKGILKNYLTDLYTSRKGNLPLTGNGRRSSFRTIPLPRMTNTFVAPGDTPPMQMIGEISKGILVKKMGGGEVNPTTGDFVFQVTEGYLIENGKIKYPIKGAMLTGNGPEVLENIQAVGNDLSFAPGVCEKAGQSVPVTDGQPTLYIKNLIIGGQETGYDFI